MVTYPDPVGMTQGLRLLLSSDIQGAGVSLRSSTDSDLEAFSHNPTDGSFAPVAVQPRANTNYPNQRFLSY